MLSRKNKLISFLLNVLIAIKLLIFIALKLKKIKNSEIVFFLPYHHIGGAAIVQLNIIESVKNLKTLIIFTKKSKSPSLLSDYKKISNCYNVYEFIRYNGVLKKIFIKYLCSAINNSKYLKTIFGSNSAFYYEILPFLNKDIKKVDLTHAFSFPDFGLENFSIPYIKYLDTRIVINSKTLNDFRELYILHNINILYHDRLLLIPNGIKLESDLNQPKNKLTYKIGYFGRWSKEKRPELFIKISKLVKLNKKNLNFVMAGTFMETHKNKIIDSNIEYLGELIGSNQKKDFYNSIDILLVTSYREGFPLVIMEAMSHGVVIISTDVGSIREHVLNDISGFIIPNKNEEELIANLFFDKILNLYNNQEKILNIGMYNRNYAKKHFDITNFYIKYNKILSCDSI